MKKPIFDGCSFNIALPFGKSTIEITKTIKDNGGTIAYMVTKQTSYLVTSEEEVKSKNTKIRTAQSHGVKIVSEAFVKDSVAAEEVLPIAPYLLSVVEEPKPAIAKKQEKESKKEPVPSHQPPAKTEAPGASSSSHLSKPTAVQLHPKVQELVEYIYSEATSSFATHFDAKVTAKGIETPLGVLSAFQIDKGERVLKEINQILKATEEEISTDSRLEQLSNQFYTLIPHNIGKNKEDLDKHVIRSLPHLQAKQEFLQLMRDMLSVSTGGALIHSEAEVRYKALKCDIEYLEKGSAAFEDAQRVAIGEQGNSNLEVVSIFKVKRANEHERFLGRSIPNHKTLFHGSRINNVVGILSRGVLPPKIVVGLGGKRTDFGWLGSGIYFANSADNSSRFTTSGSKGTRMLLIATVALGSVKEYTQITPNLERPPIGHHSTHGKPGVGSEFPEDEFVVYKPEQQKLEYLVEFKLKDESLAKPPRAIIHEAPVTSKPNEPRPLKLSSSSTPIAPSSAWKSNRPLPPSSVRTASDARGFQLSADDIDTKTKEDHYRGLFATNRNSSELKSPHLLLVDLADSSKFMYSNEPAPYPLVLQSQRELRPTTGCAVVSPDQFTKKFEKFTENQFRGMNWNNVFIAGGGVLVTMLEQQSLLAEAYKSSDIDMFFYGLNEQQANQKLKEIYDLVQKNSQSHCEVIRTKHAVTIVNQYPYRHVQIVLRLYKSPAEVLMGFDIDCCSVGYDGKTVYALPRACRAITRGFNLVDMSRRSLTYELRLYKYSKRGFAVAIPGFDRNKVNPDIFSKSLKDVKGLAQLLLFEYNALKNSASPTNPFRNRLAAQQLRHKDPYTEDRLEEFDTLRANKELPDSDYSSVYIPWGPQWFSRQILNLLLYQDKAQFFAKKDNIKHKHIFVSGIQGVLEGKSFWCKKCKEQLSRGLPEDKSAEDYVSGPLKWLQDNPGRQLLTGSFHPIDDAEWDTQAYRSAEDNVTSLHSAVFTEHLPNIRKLAASASKIQQFDSSSPTSSHPLLMAALLGNVDSVEILLRNCNQLEIADNNGFKAIHYAAAGGYVQVVKALLRHNSTQSIREPTEGSLVTPLHLACYYGHTELARYLHENDNNNNPHLYKDSAGRTPLHYACYGGYVECIQVLANSMADSHLLLQTDNNGKSPIAIATANRNQNVLDFFATINPSHFGFGQTKTAEPLASVGNSDLSVLSKVAKGNVLTSGDTNVNEFDVYRVHPLHVAASLPESYGASLDSLLNSNTKLEYNCTDIYGQTPIHYAVLYGNSSSFFKLISKNVDLRRPNFVGQTPLFYAKNLLSSFSGFENHDQVGSGLPTPQFRKGIEAIYKYLQSNIHELPALSPYPLPPLPPSIFLSAKSPYTRREATIAQSLPRPAPPTPVRPSTSTSEPVGIAAKFGDYGLGKHPLSSVFQGVQGDTFKQPQATPSLFNFGTPNVPTASSTSFGTPPTTFGSSVFKNPPAFAPPTFGSSSGPTAFMPSQPTSSFGTSTFGQPTPFGATASKPITFGQPLRAETASSTKPSPSPAQTWSTPQHPQPRSETGDAEASTSGASTPLSRLLVLFSLLHKGGKVTLDEKGDLKNAALQDDPLLSAALECYEIDGDLEEFADTARRILSMRK